MSLIICSFLMGLLLLVLMGFLRIRTALLATVPLVLSGVWWLWVEAPGIQVAAAEQRGFVVQIGEAGWIWKSWEGELAVPGRPVWRFKVDSPEVARQIAASPGGVTLVYTQFICRGERLGGSGPHVTKIK